MDDRKSRYAPWMPWALTSALLLLTAFVAYMAGTHAAGTMNDETVGRRAWMFFPFGGLWLFFVMFWVFGMLRWMFWRPWYGPWRHGRSCHPLRHDDREDWEDWHRRAHERMSAAAQDSHVRDPTGRPT